MRLSLVLVIALARTAAADTPTFLETHGIEIEVPTGWSVVNKPGVTEIMPTKYKGRGLEVIEVAKPLTKQLIIDSLAAAHAEGTQAKDGQRDGAPIVVAQARIAVKDKGMVDVDVLAVSNAKHNAVLLISFIKGDQDPLLREAN